VTVFLYDTLAQSDKEVLVNGIINRGDQVLHYPLEKRIHLRPWDELRHAADRTVPVFWGVDHPSRDPGAREIGLCDLFIPRGKQMIMGRFRLSKKLMTGKLIGRLLDKRPVKLSPGLTVEALDEEFGAAGNEVYTHYERGHRYDHILLTPDSVATRCEPPVCGVHLHDTFPGSVPPCHHLYGKDIPPGLWVAGCGSCQMTCKDRLHPRSIRDGKWVVLHPDGTATPVLDLPDTRGTSPPRHPRHEETLKPGLIVTMGLEMTPDESTQAQEDGPGSHLATQADQAGPQGQLRGTGIDRAREPGRPAEAPAKGPATEQAETPSATEAAGGGSGPAEGRVQLDDTRQALIDRIVERHPGLTPESLHTASGKLLMYLLDTGGEEPVRRSTGLPKPAGSASRQEKERPKPGDIHFIPYSQRGGKS
jgi:hypothetical protein